MCLLAEAGPCGLRAERSWAESLGCWRLNLLLFRLNLGPSSMLGTPLGPLIPSFLIFNVKENPSFQARKYFWIISAWEVKCELSRQNANV